MSLTILLAALVSILHLTPAPTWAFGRDRAPLVVSGAVSLFPAATTFW